MSLEIDFSEMPAGVVEEFRKGRVAKEVATLNKQAAIQAGIAQEFGGDHKSLEGLGRLRMVVSADAFHYWGRRLGYECWRDKQFLREFERDNAAARVKCGGTKLQVGWVAPTGQSEKRFHKSYGE
jgi:hypothetical protein